jgi:hypothetical protein
MVVRRLGVVFGKVLLASFVAALVVAITFWWGRSRSSTALVPAYFYPSGVGLDEWNRLARDAGLINIEAILNPASGPGTTQDPNYVAVVDNLRAAGGSVFGYVSTKYGDREIADVTKDINSYISFYNINGIFIDQMDNSENRVPYYKEIYRLIKGLHSDFKVIGNAGMPYTLEAYLSAADTLVIFEGPSVFYADFRPFLAAPWVLNYPPDRFAAIVYAAASEIHLIRALDKAGRAHAGSVYVTDGGLPNPYRSLPPYWAREVAAIRERDLTSASLEKRIP